MNRSMPTNIIIPVLHYPDVDQAIDWLCKTFAFKIRWRAGSHRAQLTFNHSTIVVTQSNVDGISAATHHSIMVQVKDIDAHYRHTLESGAHVNSAPTDFPYGERQYSTYDVGGHQWTFSQSIKDILPEEWGGKSYEL